MMICDWCGKPITDQIEQPVRLATNRSPVTSEPIGVDMTLTVVTQDRSAILHQDCHETICAAYLMRMMDAVAMSR